MLGVFLDDLGVLTGDLEGVFLGVFAGDLAGVFLGVLAGDLAGVLAGDCVLTGVFLGVFTSWGTGAGSGALTGVLTGVFLADLGDLTGVRLRDLAFGDLAGVFFALPERDLDGVTSPCDFLPGIIYYFSIFLDMDSFYYYKKSDWLDFVV